MVIEIRTAVDPKGAGLIKIKHKGTLRGDENVLDLDNDNLGIYNCQNSLNYIINTCVFYCV